jgi:hypothetical protein
MPAATVRGLAPSLHPHRPGAPAPWWIAEGTFARGRLRVTALTQHGAAPAPEALLTPTALLGVAAPCSLPAPFVAHLGLDPADRAMVLRTLDRWTFARLAREARLFARVSQRGRKHPLRFPEESMSALDRRRLARFHAVLPLLRAAPAYPWAPLCAPALVEVDVAARLRAHDLHATGLAGTSHDAIAGRAMVLGAVCAGELGTATVVDAREVAVASADALAAVVAAVAVAGLLARALPPPAADAAGWIPLP